MHFLMWVKDLHSMRKCFTVQGIWYVIHWGCKLELFWNKSSTSDTATTTTTSSYNYNNNNDNNNKEVTQTPVKDYQLKLVSAR